MNIDPRDLDPRSLTDDELKATIARLQREQLRRYRELLAKALASAASGDEENQ